MSDRGELVANPFGSKARETSTGALVSVEQQRAIAEVQARMIIARSNPRDPIRCMDLILRDCTRKALAESALYQFARGGTSISGPSIRLMEAIAQRWGNIASGIKEVSRSNGSSECVAYAWDLETGYYDERQFQVRHWRDTRAGGQMLKDERDIYELIANMGQRRKRAVLQAVIPGEVVEAAVAQCEETLHASADASPEAIRKMIEAFGEFAVTREQIEARCQCRAEAIRPAQMVQLRKIFASLKDGMSAPGDWFGAVPEPRAGERPRGGAPVDKLDQFERRHDRGETPQAAQQQPERDSRPQAREAPVETGGHDSWIANFNSLAPRDDHQGEPDWRTYVEGAVYLIGQAGKEDLSRLDVAKSAHLSRLRQADSDLYRSVTQAITARSKALAEPQKAA